MKLIVAGCSFSAVSQTLPDTAWSERLAEKLGGWELVNLARQGCSNGGIRIQIDEIRRQRPDFAIIEDTYAGQWIKDYSLANCKMMLGQAREKFSQIAGPTGGSSLNGAAMKSEATTDLDRLTKELETLVSGGHGYTWITG